MSPRAAWRLESLGFAESYDYSAGKADWSAMGRPIEGERANVPRVGSLARTDVPTASLHESVSDVAQRTEAAGWDTAIVVSDRGVVLGRLPRRQLEMGSNQPVEEAMRSGPSTFRPNVTVDEMLRYMNEHDMGTALVTDSEGKLFGLFERPEDEPR